MGLGRGNHEWTPMDTNLKKGRLVAAEARTASGGESRSIKPNQGKLRFVRTSKNQTVSHRRQSTTNIQWWRMVNRGRGNHEWTPMDTNLKEGRLGAADARIASGKESRSIKPNQGKLRLGKVWDEGSGVMREVSGFGIGAMLAGNRAVKMADSSYVSYCGSGAVETGQIWSNRKCVTRAPGVTTNGHESTRIRMGSGRWQKLALRARCESR